MYAILILELNVGVVVIEICSSGAETVSRYTIAYCVGNMKRGRRENALNVFNTTLMYHEVGKNFRRFGNFSKDSFRAYRTKVYAA